MFPFPFAGIIDHAGSTAFINQKLMALQCSDILRASKADQQETKAWSAGRFLYLHSLT